MRLNYLYLVILSFFVPIAAFSQTKYIVKMTNSQSLPVFTTVNGKQLYAGNDKKEKDFFNKYQGSRIYRAYPSSFRENVLQFALVETGNTDFITDLFKEFPDKYIEYEDVTNTWEPELLNDASTSNMIENECYGSYNSMNQDGVSTNNTINCGSPYFPYYPNDYTTVPVAMPTDYNTYDLNEFKYIDAPKAWGIAGGGSPAINIGVSDGKILADDFELSGKVAFPPSGDPFANLNHDPCNIVATHGTGSTITIAAKGDNNYGVVGVCYDCNITGANFNYNAILELAQTGVHVINMSWASQSSLSPEEYILTSIGESRNNVIQEIVEDYGTILVASEGRNMEYDPTGTIPQIEYSYPASFDNVISASSIHHWYEINNHPFSPFNTCVPGHQALSLVADAIPHAVRVNVVPPEPITYGCGNGIPGVPTPNGSHVYNDRVDILAPVHQHLVYSRLEYGFCPGTTSKYGGGTSHAAPLVSGTIGLMLSEDSCLVIDEVEDILKLTSKGVEHLSFNVHHKGIIGAGALQTGNAVAFVNQMNKPNGNATVCNQTFNRFDLSATRIQNKLTIENVNFVEGAKAYFKAENEINVVTNSLFEPENDGYVLLEVGEVSTPCANTNKSNKRKQSYNEDDIRYFSEEQLALNIYPNPATKQVTLQSPQFPIQQWELFNSTTKIKSGYCNSHELQIEVGDLPRGYYFFKFILSNEKIVLKKVILE